MSTEAIQEGSLRGRLKLETQDIHEQLEHDLDLVNRDLTIERYREVLVKFFGFYQPWEGRIAELRNWELRAFYEDRRKVPHLREDLAYFGIDPGAQPLCQSVPPLRTVPEALGAFYVIEGATLGGQLIFRHAQEHLGLTRDTGARFFYGYGAETGKRWKAFQELLASFSDPETDGATVAAARATFQKLHTWMRES